MEQRTNEQVAMRVSLITIVQNILLSIIKLAAGLLAHSGAMVSDAVHSASDVMSTLVVMVGVKLANKASDKEHPYGHERLECAAAIILAVLLGFTGLGIGWAGIEKIRMGSPALAVPGRLALVVAVVSMIVKEAMYWYTRAAARRLGLPLERFYQNMDRYGNTSAASIPIALDEMDRTGLLRTGQKVICAGFGAGLTWGGVLLTL